MRLALLGDIHGNAQALESVLTAARKERVASLLITGDLVGYYFSPLAVLELLSTWEKHIVRGNHEEMLRQVRTNPESLTAIESRYGSGLRLALEQLPDEVLNDLCGLPHPLTLSIDDRRIMLCHGTPHDLDIYLYPDSPLDILTGRGLETYDLVITGHTHYPMQRHLGERTLLVNPGSVGQPRNRRPGAHWALYDTETGNVSFRTETYDFTPLQAEAKSRHPELPYLADVLGRT